MSRYALLASVVLALLAGQTTLAQPNESEVVFRSAAGGSDVSPSRLAAGVRAYPAGVLRALLAIADEPLLLRQLAEDPAALDDPGKIYPPVSSEIQGALRQLQQVPELLTVASFYPSELAALRQLYSEAPEGMEARIAELSAGYRAAWVSGARNWQTLLGRERGPLEAYRELLTRFCREQIQEYPDFPCVEVTRYEYYYACPPNEIVMAYARERGVPAELDSMLQQWWRDYAPDVVDDRVLVTRGMVAVERGGKTVASMSPDRRLSMWRLASGSVDESAALVPVIMQPLDDQPLEARLAYAVAEHARLWMGPVPLDEPLDLTEMAEEIPPAGEVAEPRVVWVEPEDDADDAGVVRIYYDSDDDDYDLYDDVRTRHVDVDTHIYYSSGHPYYYSYPWTWPVIVHRYPAYYGDDICRVLGYGNRGHVRYYGSRAHVSLGLGLGTTLYYNCRAPRERVHYRHDGGRRYWRNHGAPYGGPYWRNYGASYGNHPGRDRVHRDRDRIAVRRSGGRRAPSVGRITPRTGTRLGERTIIRRPTRTQRGSRGDGLRQIPTTGTRTRVPGVSRTPTRGSSSRSPAARPSTTRRTRGSDVSRSPNRGSSSRSPAARPSSTRRTRGSGVSRSPTRGSSSRSPTARPSSTRRTRGSGISGGSGRSGGSSRGSAVRPKTPTRRPAGSRITRPNRGRSSRDSSDTSVRPRRRP